MNARSGCAGGFTNQPAPGECLIPARGNLVSENTFVRDGYLRHPQNADVAAAGLTAGSAVPRNCFLANHSPTAMLTSSPAGHRATPDRWPAVPEARHWRKHCSNAGNCLRHPKRTLPGTRQLLPALHDELFRRAPCAAQHARPVFRRTRDQVLQGNLVAQIDGDCASRPPRAPQPADSISER